MKIAILITGDRNWTDRDLIFQALNQYKNETNHVVLLHGGCSSADLISDSIGKELKFDVEIFPALWNKYGLSAGPKRNGEMVKKLNEYKSLKYKVLVLAVHDSLETSKGTKNCVKQALDFKLPIQYLKH